MLDENEAQVLRERVLARTLDDFYDCLTPGGTLLADTLGAGRDDSALEALVLELHGKLQAQPYDHVQLPFQGGGPIVPLVIMADRTISPAQCRTFQRYLLDRVVKYTQYGK